MAAVSGLYQLLRNTAAITSKLNTYQAQTGAPEIPAMFTSADIPDDAKGPLIIFRQPASAPGGNSEDREHIGGLSIVDIVLYDEKSRSSKEIRETADVVFRTVHRSEPVSTVYEMWVLATPPVQLSDPEGFPGYVVTCSVRLREKKGVES